MIHKYFLFYFFLHCSNMAGSNSSVDAAHHGDEEPPVACAELCQMANSLLEAMERMFNERLPGGRVPQHEESGDENSGFADGFHDHFRNGRARHGGGRRAGDDDQRVGRDRGRDRRVHFDDEEEILYDLDEEFDDNENPFANRGRLGPRHNHRRGAGHEGENLHGHHIRDDPDSIARVKLSVPKFSGREDVDAYLEWGEQCDQRRVNLASVEFSGFALTWWNQIQENQLVLGHNHINTWAEMKRVMRRRFVPSSYQRDLRNRLQTLRQGSKSVDECFKEMELLLVRSGISEDAKSKMARFLHGLNDEISDFVEMFPYNNLQDIVDQAKRTKRKIQQEGRGRSYGSRSISAPWHWQ